MKNKTASDKRHLDKVAQIGCIVCMNMGHPDTPASIHHIRTGVGMGRRAPHTQTIPLCPFHHQTGGYGNAYHAGAKIWQDNYGTELELLEQVHGILNA